MAIKLSGNTIIDDSRSINMLCNHVIPTNLSVDFCNSSPTDSAADGFKVGGVAAIITGNTRGNFSNTIFCGTCLELEGPFAPIAGQSVSYTMGGLNVSPTYSPATPCNYRLNFIDKLPFASTGTATDVGDLSVQKGGGGGSSSTTSGYHAAGATGPSAVDNTARIDKFPFASDTNATCIGDMTVSRRGQEGASSDASGYVIGGGDPSPGINTIDKYPFSSDTNASDVGDLNVSRRDGAAWSTTTEGWLAGGRCGPAAAQIEKFPFASDTNATCTGDLAAAASLGTGVNTEEYGYILGGNGTDGDIYKVTLASGTTSTCAGCTPIGNLYDAAGTSSRTCGFSMGGYIQSINTTGCDARCYFPYASEGNLVDHGDLRIARYNNAGAQV